jgi:hypothetical protein
VTSPFSELDTKFRQESYIKKNFNYVNYSSWRRSW